MNDLYGSAPSSERDTYRSRLVVADDLALNADSLSDMLRLMGHDVVTAYDGRGALSAHDWFHPDAYILDLQMPEMDGYATCRALRQRPGAEALAIVAFSAWGRVQDLTRALEVGFSSFLLKPAHPRDIVRCLSDVWARRTPPNRRRNDP